MELRSTCVYLTAPPDACRDPQLLRCASACSYRVLLPQVHESMLLVDVMFAQLSVLRASKIRNSGEGEKFVNLSKITKPGDLITVRIEDIETSKRRSAKGKNLDGSHTYCPDVSEIYVRC